MLKKLSAVLMVALMAMSITVMVSAADEPAEDELSTIVNVRVEQTQAQFDNMDNVNTLSEANAVIEPRTPASVGISACVGSVCVASGCAVSYCLGSGCGSSVCLGSGCVASACGGSGCGGSACYNSLCGASGCVGSACFGSCI